MKLRFQASVAAVALAVAALGAATVAPSAAEAKTTTYRFVLNGKSETPPTDSKGTGTGTATYDDETKELSWTVKYSGLTGDATAAHFHGPAKVGQPAGVMVPAMAKGGALISPIIGSATLTDDQAKALTDGMMYFNIHTAKNPDGEIRGQVVKAGGMKMDMKKKAPAKGSETPAAPADQPKQ